MPQNIQATREGVSPRLSAALPDGALLTEIMLFHVQPQRVRPTRTSLPPQSGAQGNSPLEVRRADPHSSRRTATERFRLACSLNWDYVRSVVKRRVELSPDAVRQLRALRAHDRGLVNEQIREQLEESDARREARSRFRLRRPSRVADYELRIRDWRVFYRVVGDTVQVVLIGRKRGNFLIIDRKRFIL